MGRVTTSTTARPAPALRGALTPSEAAAYLGISRNSFDRHVLTEIPVVRRGRLVLIPIRELDRWLEQNAERTLE
jgi:excisionase family DNA binding protein